MIPLPGVRDKGSAPLLGARRVGELGPFGVRPANADEPEPADDLDVDDGQGDEPVPESTSAVELAVQRRIAAAKVRIAAAQQRRESFAEARKHGLRRRHAAKLKHLAEQRRSEQQQDD